MPDIHVTAAIIWREGKLLACRRPVGKRMGGLWELPGGKIEAGETPEQCLARELQEELAVQTCVRRLFLTVTRDEPEGRLHLSAYLCDVVAGDLTPLEHEAILWLAPDEIESVTWAPADRPIVARLRSSRPDLDA